MYENINNPNSMTSKNNYPATKIISMILSFIASAFLIYFAADTAKGISELVANFKASIAGAEGVPAGYENIIIPYYIQMILVFVSAILPIIGALIPNKHSKTAILFTAIPISAAFSKVQYVAEYFVAKSFAEITLKQYLPMILAFAASILLFVSVIFLIIEKKQKNVVYVEDLTENEEASDILTSYIEEDIADEDYTESEEAAEEETKESDEATVETEETTEE